MNEPILDPIFELLKMTPRIWAHRHRSDQHPHSFDRDFVDFCDTCSDRLKLAIEEGRACPKHPLAYYEPESAKHPAFCERCHENV